MSIMWIYEKSNKEVKEMSEVINLDLYFTDYVTKADRREVYKNELTNEIIENAQKLLQKVNGLLNELGISKSDVTSGWRPPTVNAQVTNAAKRSAHMIGLAVDLLDNTNQDLAKLIASQPDLLRKYGLFIEDMSSTRGKNTNWCHLDYMTRQDRPSRVFKP